MPRYKLTIEYDGTPFSGWQIQDTAPTVQGALEAAVKAICGEDVRVHGAGRTDAGVHARGQVAHCDIAKHFPPGRFRDGLNAHLRPNPIGVLAADIVPDDFEARFSATKRHYLYRITNTRANLALDGAPSRLKILRCEKVERSGAPGELLDDRLTVACKDGAIRILELQRAGKAPMKAAEFLRGTPLKPPARLG